MATLWGKLSLPKDSCTLVWVTLLHLLLVTLGCLLVGVALGDAFASIAASIVVGYWIWGAATAVFGVTLGVLFVLSIIGILIVTPFMIYDISDEDSTNPVTKTIYNLKIIKQGWKEKYCPMVVEVKEEK